jgi:hypothetical protein
MTNYPMQGSMIPSVIDALISCLQGQSFTVIDGPGNTDDNIRSALFVGLNNPDSPDVIGAAVSDEQWAWLGHDVRDETAQIHCLAEAWNGDADQKAARDTVFGTLTTVTTMIQNNPQLCPDNDTSKPGTVMWVQSIGSLSFDQTQDANGAYARLGFDITLRGRGS